MRNIAIITARSGSKGLPDKNIKELNKKPLIAYTILSALESNCFDTIMVSTDSEYYAEIARMYGAEVPFLRSDFASSDTASSWDVVREVLENYKKMGQNFDTVCLLQPTSPLRNAIDIREGYNLFRDKLADAITSVTPMEHSPLWCMTLSEDLSLDEYKKSEKGNAPRQLLEKYYRLNGAIYIRRISENGIDIIDEKEYALVMPQERSVDIDTILDFEYAEFILQRIENNNSVRR